MMLIDERFENCFPQLGQTLKRAGLVRSHEAGIADHVGGKNGGKSAFQDHLSFTPETSDHGVENPWRRAAALV